MYNEEAKKNISNYNITYRYFRFFAKSVFLHIVEKIKSCFADLNLTVGLADRSLRWKKINLIGTRGLLVTIQKVSVLDYKALHECRITYGNDSLTPND